MLANPEARRFLDDAFAALTHPYRRHLLFALLEAAESSDPTVAYDSIPEFAVDSASVQLHHNHLPRLHENGFVEWRTAEKTIAQGARWPDIEPLLSVLYAHATEVLRSVGACDDQPY